MRLYVILSSSDIVFMQTDCVCNHLSLLTLSHIVIHFQQQQKQQQANRESINQQCPDILNREASEVVLEYDDQQHQTELRPEYC